MSKTPSKGGINNDLTRAYKRDKKITKDDRKMLLRLEKYLLKTIKFGGLDGKQARVDGCDNTLRQTKSWMEDNKIDFNKWKNKFDSTGGYCDCEVLLNSFHAFGIGS